MRIQIIALLASCPLVAACNCDERFDPAVGVELYDATTGARICDAEVVAIGEQNAELSDILGGDCRFAGIATAGDYTIVARSPGYHDATTEISVSSDGCHPEYLGTLDMALEPVN